MNSNALIERAKERAHSHFMDKRANCAEAVFRAIHEIIDNNYSSEVSNLMTPLGGGVGISGANCGAMLGGIVALALVYGRANPSGKSLEDHRRELWKTYSLYNQLPHRFRGKFGTIECRDLTKDYIYGTKRCRAFCEDLVTETAGMVMELLLEAKEHGLDFGFKETILNQAAEASGLTIEDLIEYKTRARAFPVGVK